MKALAEAIAADASLSNEAKADSLAHVSAMGEDRARPPAQGGSVFSERWSVGSSH